MRHPSSVTTSGVPTPPYAGSSLDQRSRQTCCRDGGAISGSGNAARDQVGAEVDDQQALVFGDLATRTAARRPRRRARRHPPRPAAGVQTRHRRAAARADPGAAARMRTCSSRSVHRSLQRSNVAGSCGAGSRACASGRRQLGNCPGTPRAPSERPAPVRLRGPQNTETGSRRRTPGPGTASAYRASAGTARSSRGSARARRTDASRDPSPVLATWSWFSMKLTNAAGGRPSVGVPRGCFCHAYRCPWKR